MKLTTEQQKLVEENHKLIYWYINSNNLEFSEYYDLLAIELCNTAMKYNPERGSFATYFKLRADGILYKEYRKNQAQKRSHVNVALLDNLHTIVDETDLADSIELKGLMDGEYGEILRLRADGYSQTEIAEMLGTNQSKISKIIKKIKQQYMDKGEE